MHETLLQVVAEHCDCVASVSLECCKEIVVHYERDISRLQLIHSDGVHPAKCVGYLVFWVRKLKPISMAYSLSAIQRAKPDEELNESLLINEEAAIFLALHLTLSYAEDGILSYDEKTSVYIGGEKTDAERERLKAFVGCLQQLILGYLNNKIDAGHERGNIFTSLVYDMRYRTFGPHHVVHFINHLVYAARSKFGGSTDGDIAS